MESISCALCALPAMVMFPGGTSHRLLGNEPKSGALWMLFSPIFANRPISLHARMPATLVTVGKLWQARVAVGGSSIP
jgi:hypothetical protein